MDSIIKMIKDIDLKLQKKINNYNNYNNKNMIITYDRTITTSLLIINILNLVKKRFQLYKSL